MDIRSSVIADLGALYDGYFDKNESKAFMEAFESGIKVCRCVVYMDRTIPGAPVPRLIHAVDSLEAILKKSNSLGSQSFLALLMITQKIYPGCKFMVTFGHKDENDKTADEFMSLFDAPDSHYARYANVIHSILAKDAKMAEVISERARKFGIIVGRMFKFKGKLDRIVLTNALFESKSIMDIDMFLIQFHDQDKPESTPIVSNKTYRDRLQRFIKMFKERKPNIKFACFYLPDEYDYEGVWAKLKEIGFDYIISSTNNMEPDQLLFETEESKPTLLPRPNLVLRPKKLVDGWKY